MQEVLIVASSLDNAIDAWLHAKGQHSGSAHTVRAYQHALLSFRAALHSQGLDLDSDARAVALVAQVWASARERGAHRTGDMVVKGATHNQRLACISSFYTFAFRRGLAGITTNPIKAMEKRSEADSTHAHVFDSTVAGEALSKIDRSTRAGLRDYALLSIAFATGRRAAELAALRCGDIERVNGRIILHFRRTKGGKHMDDELPPRTADALLRYVSTVHGVDLSRLDADAPLWLSFSPNAKPTKDPITTQAIADICKKHLGVSTVHSTRHTWAKTMDMLGAPVTLIQRRMGHSNLAVTTRYLASLPEPVNPFAEQLEAVLGID